MTLVTQHPILIVEDSEDDFEVTERSLRRDGGIANPIVRFEDGQAALDYILQRGAYSPESAPRPGLVMLDLNLPGLDGRQVLEAVKGNVETRSIPVVVLTTSDDEKDISHCYKAGASSYIKKPVSLEGFYRAMQSLKNYWFEVAILPRGKAS